MNAAIRTGAAGMRAPNSTLGFRITEIAERGPLAVNQRLTELEREWTTGRLVKAVTGAMLIVGIALGGFLHPYWLLLTALAGAVLVQYWFFRHSSLSELFRNFGFRTGAEIEDERLALRVLRGDFRLLPTLHQLEDRDAVTRMEGEGGIAVDDDDFELKYDPKDAVNLILQSSR